MEDGKPTDEVVSLKDASIPVQDLKPTQNEIALDKSLSFPLTNPKSTADCLKGGTVAIAGKRIITAKGQYIVDGHHRWSQLYAMNKDASIAFLTLYILGLDAFTKFIFNMFVLYLDTSSCNIP